MAEVTKEKKKLEPKTISISIILILGIVALAVGTIFLLKGNNKANSVSLDTILNNMKNMNSYSVEFKITDGESYTSEYLIDVDNEHKYTKYQFINRELVTTNYVAYLDYEKSVEHYLNEEEKLTTEFDNTRLARIEDIFDRLKTANLSNYNNGVYTITMNKDEFNTYNTNHDTLLQQLQVMNEKTEVSSSDVTYYVTIDKDKVTKIEFKVENFTLTYLFSNYNNAAVTLPALDNEGNVVGNFVDEFRVNHPELLQEEAQEDTQEVQEVEEVPEEVVASE